MNEIFLRENLEKDDHLRTMKRILKNTVSGQEKNTKETIQEVIYISNVNIHFVCCFKIFNFLI